MTAAPESAQPQRFSDLPDAPGLGASEEGWRESHRKSGECRQAQHAPTVRRAIAAGPPQLVTGCADPRSDPAFEEGGIDWAKALRDALDAAVRHLRRFVWLPYAEQYDAIGLWCAHTHVVDRCEFSPILHLTSPVWRSGKSRVLEVIEHVVARPWKVIGPTEAVLFREVDEHQPTLLLDEADSTFNPTAVKRGDSEPIRALLNAGNRRGATIPRMVPKGRGFERCDFNIYCAKAVAGIGDLPATVADRSIRIVMERKGVDDHVERLRLRDAESLGCPIRDAMQAAVAGVNELTLPAPELPDELDDRAQDGWEPLLAIARLAGGTGQHGPAQLL